MTDPEMAPMESSLDGLIASVDRQTDEGAAMAWGLESIKDIQGTIRAVDAKIGILLAALAFPLKDVAEHYISAHSTGISFASVLFTLAVISYGFGILLSVLTLSGIGGSHHHATGSGHFNTFYAAGLFRLNFMDALFRRKEVRSTMSVEEFVDGIPKTCDRMLLDLASEMMQLAYIRDLKILRQRYAFLFTGVAFLLGFVGFALMQK
jgi:hypothetical protein